MMEKKDLLLAEFNILRMVKDTEIKEDTNAQERYRYILASQDNKFYTIEKYYREEEYTIQEQNGNLTPFVERLLKLDDLDFIKHIEFSTH